MPRPLRVKACYILHNFLIVKGDIREVNQDKESNSKVLFKFEYISKDERRSKNTPSIKETQDSTYG
jgi:hypothetical protein